MKISSLDRIDINDRAAILADLALALSPNPNADARLTSAQAQIVEEFRSSLRNAQGWEAKFDQYLAEELSKSVLADTDEEGLLGLAGLTGKLLPGLYRVVISESFRKSFRPFRVRDEDVVAAVSHSSDYQHLEMGSDDNSVSLFLKRFDFGSKHEPFWGIAQMHRFGRSLGAHCFWRIYESEIDISAAERPLDILRSFVSFMSLPFMINGVEKSWFENEYVPGLTDNVQCTWPRRNDVVSNVLTCSVGKKVEPDRHRIILSFVIDGLKYRNYLIRHGVQIR